jgi:hypothetical protein
MPIKTEKSIRVGVVILAVLSVAILILELISGIIGGAKQ